MTFQKAEGLGGLAETLDRWKDQAMKAPSVEMTTVTLDDILTRAKAPSFIHFMSLDIEGAELEALRAFPFDRIRLGALAHRAQLRGAEAHAIGRVSGRARLPARRIPIARTISTRPPPPADHRRALGRSPAAWDGGRRDVQDAFRGSSKLPEGHGCDRCGGAGARSRRRSAAQGPASAAAEARTPAPAAPRETDPVVEVEAGPDRPAGQRLHARRAEVSRLRYVASNPGSSFRGTPRVDHQLRRQPSARVPYLLSRGIVGGDGPWLLQGRGQADGGAVPWHGWACSTRRWRSTTRIVTGSRCYPCGEPA